MNRKSIFPLLFVMSFSSAFFVQQAAAGTIPEAGSRISNPRLFASSSSFSSHTCSVRQDGTLQCWGNNSDGQIGNGSVGGIQPAPVSVSGINNVRVLTSVVAGAAGQLHTCAVLLNGIVACWGKNGDGQLGVSSAPLQQPVPVAIPSNIINTAMSITAGEFHTCALLVDGTMRCWGLARDGQLGIGPPS